MSRRPRGRPGPAGPGALLLALLLAACRRPAGDTRPGPAASGEPPPPPPAPALAGQPVLVWGRMSGASGYTSLWLDPAGAERERRPGLWLPAPGPPASGPPAARPPVALRIEAEPRPAPACPSGAEPFAHAVWQRAVLVDAAGARVPLELPGEAAPERQVEPVTSHAGRLIVRVAEVTDPCADPPRHRVSAVSVALASGAVTVEARDDAPGAPAVRAWVDARRAHALAPLLGALPRLPAGFSLAGGDALGAP